MIQSNGNIPYTEDEKKIRIEEASKHFGCFMEALGFDYKTDPNAMDTPHRVSKAYMNELLFGCFSNQPKITAFDNVDKYDGMVCQTNIKVVSLCAHHWLPFTGVAHVAYIPTEEGKVIGLSKLNRIVDWFARRAQIQESLCMQIHNYVNNVCEGNKGVSVLLEAAHTCCSNRGIGHSSNMKTAKMSGVFLDNNNNARAEFYKFVEFAKNNPS